MQELEGKVRAATLSADDLAPSASESPEREDARAVLDDIDWPLVAEKVPTRNRTQCMDKWYRRLAPSMVARGVLSPTPHNPCHLHSVHCRCSKGHHARGV